MFYSVHERNGLKVMIIKTVNYMFGGFKNNMDDPLVHKNSEPLTFHSFFRDTCANIYLWQVHLKFLWHLTDMFRTYDFASFNLTLYRYAFIQEFLRSFIKSSLYVCCCFFCVFFYLILMYVQSSFFLISNAKQLSLC